MERLARTPAALNRIYSATGVPNVFYNSSLQLEETITRCPGIEDLATRCLFLADYFNFLLSGRMENEISSASTTQLLQVHGLDWSRPTSRLFFGSHPPGSRSRFSPTRCSVPCAGSPELKGATACRCAGSLTPPAHSRPCRRGRVVGTSSSASGRFWSLVGFGERHFPVLGSEALRERISNERTGDGRYRPLTNVIGLWLLERTLRELSARPASNKEWGQLMNAAERLPISGHLLDTRDPAFANPPSMKAAIDAQLRKRRLPVPRSIPALHASHLRLPREGARGCAPHLRAAHKTKIRPDPHRRRRIPEPPPLPGDRRRERAAGPRLCSRGDGGGKHRQPARRAARRPKPRQLPGELRQATFSHRLSGASQVRPIT